MHSTKSPRGVRQYACRARPGQPQCGRLAIYASPVEVIVGERLLDRLDKPGLAAALASLGDGTATAAADELADAETDRDEIEQMRVVGAIKQDAFLRMHGPAETRVEAARKALKAASGRSVLADHADDLGAWWDAISTTVEERREVLTAVLERVVIAPSTGSTRFDGGRVQIPRDAWRV